MRTLAALLAGLGLAALLVVALPPLRRLFAPDPGVTVEAALEAIRREEKLVVFSARLVVEASATYAATAAGLEIPGTAARRTLIVPGSVSYALDLAKLGPRDLGWDAEAEELTVRRPPLLVLPPAPDLARAKSYGEAGLLAPLTSADRVLDELTRQSVATRLAEEAENPELLALAQAAADSALARAFELPLRAAGFSRARVRVTP
ncbi:DUF4230 domain-containing protein [Thermaurantiacus sp.]